MNTILLIYLLWLASGIASYIYWHTKEYDFQVTDLAIALSNAILIGPFTFLVGWIIVGKGEFPDSVLWKRRKKNE